MAHIAKYKGGALGNMCGHYDRWRGDLEKAAVRDNIDPALTHLNYNLAPERNGGQVRFVHERISALQLKRKPRKDAVLMCDCVLTAPKSLDRSELHAFFKSGYEFLAERYGRENVVSAYVHFDEPGAQPHMHFAFVPVTDDGRLAAKDVVNRQDLRTLHGDMQRSVEAALGHHVEIVLDPEKEIDKQLSALPNSEYRAAKDALAATHAEIDAQNERLEHLQRQEIELAGEVAELESKALEPAAETVRESAGAILAGRGDGSRESALTDEIGQLRSRIGELEGANQRARERIKQLGERIGELRAGIKRAAAGVERLARLVIERRGELNLRFDSREAGRAACAVLDRLGIAYTAAIGKPDPFEEARQAARAYNAAHRRTQPGIHRNAR